MSGKIALIIGATGAIGPALVRCLITNGYSVRTYGKDSAAPDLFPDGVTQLYGDINDSRAVSDALRGVDVVFHLAALLHISNPAPELEKQYQRINVEGSRNVSEVAAKMGVQRLIYFSTVKEYGIQRRELVNESIVPHPKTLYARSKLDGENVVLSTPNLQSTVLRLSAVYGPRLKGTSPQLV